MNPEETFLAVKMKLYNSNSVVTISKASES